MKNQIQLPTIFAIIIFLFFEFSLSAQIQDIKKNSNENKSNNSNSNSSNSSSSSSDIGSEIATGCFSSIFDIFTGCLFSGHNNSENNNDNVVNNNVQENQNLIPPDSAVIPYKNPENNVITDNPIINNENQNLNIKKEPKEFSLDLNANFALGFEYSKEKTYKYYDFLPGIRANLAWFLIDYRYNILTEFSQDLPDAFKTWDLLFLLNLKANENAKLIFGAGMHREEYSQTTFFEYYLGAKFGLLQNRDYIDIGGRISIDFNDAANPDDNVFPFTEVGIHYNKRFMNAKNLNGYFSVGGIYQNYYSSTDIWAIKVGVILNWHN